jgi:hypothetical protein
MNGSLLGGAAQAWRYAADFVRDRKRARQAVNEVRALDTNEAARVLGEVGLSRREFEEAMTRPFASEDLMLKGMDAVGIDADECSVRNPAWFHDMERTCAMCRVRSRCRQIQTRGEFSRRYRDFCPNSRDFAQILSAQALGSAAYYEVPWRDPEAPFQPNSTQSGHGC